MLEFFTKISALQGHAQRAQIAEQTQQAQHAQRAQHAQQAQLEEQPQLLEQQVRELKEVKSQVVIQQLAQDQSSAEKVWSFENMSLQQCYSRMSFHKQNHCKL